MTIRMRLTLLYASAFFIAGALLIGIMYLQLHQVVGQQLVVRNVIVGPPALEAPLPEPPDVLVQREPGLLAEAQAQLGKARAAALQRMMLVSIVSLVAVGVLAAVLGWLLAGQALQPLRQITSTVRGIADRNLHQRIAMSGPKDEIRDLADTLDGMLERLHRAFDSQQRFIANASHELRTPLTLNRTLIEVAMLKEARPDSALAQMGSTLLAVNRRHEDLIDGLLMLASGEQEIADPVDTDIAQLARHTLGECAGAAQAAGVEVRTQFAPAPCRGDPVLLERCIHNLVDNALRYNVASGGWVGIATGTDAQGQAFVRIENSGPAVPPHEVPRLFEPFRRLASVERQADTSVLPVRRGAGLGLSIVRAIATSHRGRIEAQARAAGGLAIEVMVPARVN
jgi:signal transduction histidine kinase